MRTASCRPSASPRQLSMTRSRLPGRACTSIAALAIALTFVRAWATETHQFALDTPRALAGASSLGIAVFADGSLSPLPPLEAVASFDEPLGLALAVAPDGTAFVGTGHPARVYTLRDGKKQLLAELEADQVTALLIEPKGSLWAATAAPATLVRVPSGAKAEIASRLPEGEIWDLAWYRDGIVAAAGNPGRILRLGATGLELAAPVPDRHARCLAVSGDTVLIGTSGKGLILRWSGDGPPGVLYDSPFTEIAALTVDAAGTVWAAALTGDPTLGKPAKEDGEGVATVTTSESAPQSDTGGATSEILRVLPQGAVTTVHRFTPQIAGTLASGENGLVIGTGAEGQIWQLVEGSMAELDTIDAAQVVRLARGGNWVLSQGPVRLFRRHGTPRGSFLSPPLDAGQPARWGELHITADLDRTSRCTVFLRSGAAAQPDESWSEWSAGAPCSNPAASAPPARYVQWKLAIEASSESAGRVRQVALAYRQINLAPEFKEVNVHGPGEVFLKAPPPSDKVVEVQHPDLAGIFTTLDDDAEEKQPSLGKKYYRVGYQTVSWKAEDPNGDPLRFTVEVQQSGSGAFWPIRKALETTTLALDTHALADGTYRFRVTATDAPANPDEPGSNSQLSPYFVVDNSPPRISIKRQGEAWLVDVEDALSPLTRVEWNRDADAWHPLTPLDGLLDGKRESFRFPAAAGPHVLAVRAIDDHHNRAVLAMEERP